MVRKAISEHAQEHAPGSSEIYETSDISPAVLDAMGELFGEISDHTESTRRKVKTALQEGLQVVYRDELINLAGGLLVTLSRNAPYFSEVLVADTGSKDGTRELLEHICAKSYLPNIRVLDLRFQNMAQVREEANDCVETDYTCMIDADEIMISGTPEAIRQELDEVENIRSISFPNYLVSPDVPHPVKEPNTWYNRFFVSRDAYFERAFAGDGFGQHFGGGNIAEKILVGGEDVSFDTSECYTNRSINLKDGHGLLHFKPNRSRESIKGIWKVVTSLLLSGNAPSETKYFTSWKMPNAEFLREYGIDLKEVIKHLKNIGLKVHPDFIKYSGILLLH